LRTYKTTMKIMINMKLSRNEWAYWMIITYSVLIWMILNNTSMLSILPIRCTAFYRCCIVAFCLIFQQDDHKQIATSKKTNKTYTWSLNLHTTAGLSPFNIPHQQIQSTSRRRWW
jgi:hypothetical protein